MLNEKQIQYLLMVDETRNITEAARRLYISQPALSRMILDIEKSLGTQLFVRDRGDLHLSQAGEIYLSGCRDALTIRNGVLKKINEMSEGQTGQIVFGITNLTGEYIVPQILDTFTTHYPNVEIVLLEDRMNILQQKVRAGKIDIALVYHADEDTLEYEKLIDNKVYVQVPPWFAKEQGWDKSMSKGRAVNAHFLDGQSMILLKKGRGMREISDLFFEHFQTRPGKQVETDNIHLAQHLVQIGWGFTFVPEIALRHKLRHSAEDVYFTEIQDWPMQRTMYCCHRKTEYLTAAELFLIQELPKIVSGQTI